MSKEIRNKKIEKVKNLIKSTVCFVVIFILLYRFSITTIPLYGALYFYFPLFEKISKDDKWTTKLKKWILPNKGSSLKLGDYSTFLNRVSIFQNRTKEGNQSHFAKSDNKDLPPYFSIINTREPICGDTCPKTLEDANNFKIYRVNFNELNVWQKLIYCGFSVVQVIVTMISAFLLWCGCWLPRSNYSLFSMSSAVNCESNPKICKANGNMKAKSNLKRFWTWVTTLGVDREVYNYKYFLGLIDRKTGKIKEDLSDNDCSVPGINIGFDKWWCRIKKIYFQFLIYYFIMQILKSGMNTQFTKILTGFGGVFALIFSIILLSYYFIFKGYNFFSFTTRDAILFPAFNINGTNFNTEEGEGKPATSMFTNRNLQDLILDESKLNKGTFQKVFNNICKLIMDKRSERKRIMLMEESATKKAMAAVEKEVQLEKEQNAKNMMNKYGLTPNKQQGNTSNMAGVNGIPQQSAPKLSNIQGMPPSYNNSLKMRGGKSKRLKKLQFTPEKIEEFKNMLMQLANMNMKQITYQ